MYSNTIYILNNTIIEWFDSFKQKKKREKFQVTKPLPPEQI